MKCGKDFRSGNQLWGHIRNTGHRVKNARRSFKKETAEPTQAHDSTVDVLHGEVQHIDDVSHKSVIVSKAATIKGDGLAFRSWHFLTTQIYFSIVGKPEQYCVDTGCGMSLVDRRFFKEHLPNQAILRHDALVILRGIGKNRHTTNEYVIVVLFLYGFTPRGESTFIKITREFHIVNNLKANMLLGIDILKPERVVIDLPRKKLIFGSYDDTEVEAEPSARENTRIRRVVRADKAQLIPAHSTGLISIKKKGKGFLPDRDFIFEPDIEGGYHHYVDSLTDFVMIENIIERPLTFRTNQRLNVITESDNEEAMIVDSSEEIAEAMTKDGWTSERTPETTSSLTKSIVDPSLETKLSNSVSIYGQGEEAYQLR